MSVAPLLRRQEEEEATEEEDTHIYQRILTITPDTKYRSLFLETVAANANIGLTSDIPLSDEDYLQFFVRSIAKEVKALSASSGIPNFLTGRAAELKLAKPNTLTSLLGVTPSAAPHYKNLSLNVRRPGKPQPPYIASALLVLEESVRALETGSPLAFGPLKDIPTTLFLYYRRPDGIIPTYSGHIFIQEAGPWLFFVSIYKSMFEEERGLSDRILDDVIAYAKAKGFMGVFTSPLESMKGTLIRRGIVPDEASGTYTLRFPTVAVAATGGSAATGGAGTQGGGRRRLTRSRQTRRGRRKESRSSSRVRSRRH